MIGAMKSFIVLVVAICSFSAFAQAPQSNIPATPEQALAQLENKCEQKIRNVIPKQKAIEDAEAQLKNDENTLRQYHSSGTKYKSDNYVEARQRSIDELNNTTIPKAKAKVAQAKKKFENAIQAAKQTCRQFGYSQACSEN